MSHTPGPWEAVGKTVRTCRNADGTGGFEISECSLFQEHRREDARLIAAAPEMLTVLEAIVLETVERPDVAPFCIYSYLPPQLIEQAQAAIAKAKGE